MGVLKHAIENIRNINDIIKNNNCTVFIETGTGMTLSNSSLAWAMNNLKLEHYYSIEIDNFIYQKNVEFFNDRKNLTLINDNSCNGLEKIFKNCKNKSKIYWLDAHYPGLNYTNNNIEYEKDPHIRIPTYNELKLICNKTDVTNDIFCFDDLRIFMSGPFEDGNHDNCVTGNKYDKKVSGGLSLGLEDNIEWIKDFLGKTHDFHISYKKCGYLTCTPKN
jgi:hypothetical protein